MVHTDRSQGVDNMTAVLRTVRQYWRGEPESYAVEVRELRRYFRPFHTPRSALWPPPCAPCRVLHLIGANAHWMPTGAPICDL